MYRSYSGHTAVIVIATAVIHFRCQGGEIHRSAGGGAVAMLPDNERMDVLALDSAAPNLEPRGIRASGHQGISKTRNTLPGGFCRLVGTSTGASYGAGGGN